MPEVFSYTYGGLTIYEAGNGFYITDGHETRGMGDGVDMFATDDGTTLLVGTRKFYAALRKSLRLDASGYREAYFG